MGRRHHQKGGGHHLAAKRVPSLHIRQGWEGLRRHQVRQLVAGRGLFHSTAQCNSTRAEAGHHSGVRQPALLARDRRRGF